MDSSWGLSEALDVLAVGRGLALALVFVGMGTMTPPAPG
jgi:hypothetical protein